MAQSSPRRWQRLLGLGWRWSWLVALPLAALCLSWASRTYSLVQAYGSGHPLPEDPERLLYSIGKMELQHSLRRAGLAVRGRSRPAGGRLPELSLFVAQADLQRLERTQQTPKQLYVEAWLRYPEGEIRPIELKRRQLGAEWTFYKKSLRIKTKKRHLFLGLRGFHLIPPELDSQLNNFLAYRLAATLGLLAPRHELVNLRINGENAGLHLLVEDLGESTLRRSRRMPGDLYRGVRATHPPSAGFESSLFLDPSRWRKAAVNNNHPEDSFAPMERLAQTLARNEPRPCGELERLLPPETWGRFLAYQTLAQTLSPSDDDWHLYFDPARQAFEPAVWDPDGWHTDQLAGDTDSGHLHEVLMAVDDVQRARHRTIEDFFAQSLDQAFLTEIDQAIDLVEPAIRVDPHLVSGFDVIEPQQVLGAILGLRATIARGFDEVRAAHLADRYRFEVPPDPQTRATDTSRCPRPKGPPLVWSGTKVVDEVLLIENDLVIQPGTTVRLAAGASIVVEGRLDAEGTAEAPIRFGPAQEQQEPWGAIVLRGAGANGSALRHCELSLGSGLINEIDGYSAMLSVHDVQDVSISDCHFRDNRLVDDMLRTVYSKVEIRHCHFDNALFDAIDLDISHGTIEGCVFDTSGNDALDLMTSEVLVAGNRISGAGDKGISVGEQTRLFAVDNLLADNRIGIESKDGSEAWVYNSTFRDNTLALHAYLKNWRYGRGGTIHLQYSTIEGIGDVAVAARRSAIRIGATTTSIAPGSSKRIEMTHEPLSSEVPAWAQPFISRVVPSRQGWQSHGH